MHRIDTSTATSDGLFTEGDPLVPTPATVVSADWLNSVQEELAAIVTNAGLELQKADNTQLLTAILQIIARQSSELERLRLLKIGCPMYWRSTTLPENFAWVNGDLVLFEDWPEFAAVYNAGGFSGMVLPYNADSATIAANLGKFRPNAANPTGLYLPSCGEQFFRAWTGGWRGAGSSQSDAMQNITGAIWDFPVTAPMTFLATSGAFTRPGSTESALLQSLYSSMNEIGYGDGVTLDVSRVVRTSTENRPVNVAVPTMLYLGIPA